MVSRRKTHVGLVISLKAVIEVVLLLFSVFFAVIMSRLNEEVVGVGGATSAIDKPDFTLSDICFWERKKNRKKNFLSSVKVNCGI